MKTITLLLLCLSSMVFSQNTYVPDDNFEQALIDAGYDAGPLDDYVPTANISSITNLSVSNKNIADLTGIEDFVALTNLLCWNNNLTQLDLSQNTALTSLKCNGNQLTTLDLSNNTALTSIKVYVNQLQTLDVSMLPNLDEIRCEGNQLTELNVQNGNNAIITNFIANNNPNLNCINVDDQTYSEANWTNVDAQTGFSENCPALSIDEFTTNTVSIYPNPTKGNLNVSSNTQVDTIIVYNVLGEITAQKANSNRIDLSQLQPGMYMVQVKSGTQKIIKKILVE